MAERLDILIERCKKGDRKSQELLFRRFSEAMYGICLQYASSETEAQDVLQDGFVKVFAKLDQVRDPKAFPGWIRRLMINTALERYRGQTIMEPLNDHPAAGGKEVAYGVLEEMAADDLVRLIRSLPPKYRMVFNLYAVEGYTHREIGEMLGISEGTSKSNLSRARTLLQQKIKRLHGTESVTK